MSRKILAITTSPIPYGNNITDGPGYRAWNLLETFSQKHDVTILSLFESYHLGMTNDYDILENNIRIKITHHSPRRIADFIKKLNPDLLYLPWSSTPFLARVNKKIPTIIDYVGPGLIEDYATKGYISGSLLQLKLKSFWLGDFFITAGQRERYYLLGLMVASKKLCVSIHDKRDALIHFLPMTPPREPPFSIAESTIKEAGTFTMLVAGAFLPWYDYANLIRAVKILKKEEKIKLKVVFMGKSPKDTKYASQVKKMGNIDEVKDSLVFTGSVPFKQRSKYYLQADVAINIPSSSIEDELSVRTRVIDYLWASLPTVTPANDEYSSIIVNNGGGFAYKATDPLSLAQTIKKLIENPAQLEAAKAKMPFILKTNFSLENFVEPLDAFITNPIIDPSRFLPKSFRTEAFLWIRDTFDFLKK